MFNVFAGLKIGEKSRFGIWGRKKESKSEHFGKSN